MKKKVYLLILVIIFMLFLAVGIWYNSKLQNNQIGVKLSPGITPPVASPSFLPELITESPIPSATALPASFLIEDFPFQSQAPFANWDQLHDEACEEASLALVYYYLNDKGLSSAAMDEEILRMVDWQNQNLGGHYDLTVSQVGQMAREFYSMEDFKVERNIDIDDIKNEIAQGHPVILPTAGRLLGNPYFRSPGPIYHMVVAIGYTDNSIIVQDVGTKRGNQYFYNDQLLLNAIHDWNGSPENINSGSKNMLVFY